MAAVKQQFIKVFWITILCIFLSACSKECREWSYDEVIAFCPDFNSKKARLPAVNKFRGLKLEITQTCSGQRCYIDVYSFSLPREKDHPCKTRVSLGCQGCFRDFVADRFEGGQRLMLPLEAEEFIVSNLHEGKVVTATIGRYTEEIIPKGFCKAYFHLSD